MRWGLTKVGLPQMLLLLLIVVVGDIIEIHRPILHGPSCLWACMLTARSRMHPGLQRVGTICNDISDATSGGEARGQGPATQGHCIIPHLIMTALQWSLVRTLDRKPWWVGPALLTLAQGHSLWHAGPALGSGWPSGHGGPAACLMLTSGMREVPPGHCACLMKAGSSFMGCFWVVPRR